MARRTARACASQTIHASGASSYIATTLTNFIGKSGYVSIPELGLVSECLSWLGTETERQAIDRLAETVFLPIAVILHKKAAEQTLGYGLSYALDLGAISMTKSLLGENYSKLERFSVGADEATFYANATTSAYVYGMPLYYGTKLVLNLFEVKHRLNTLNTILSGLDLDQMREQEGITTSAAQLKITISAIVLTLMETSALAGIDLNNLFNDQEAIRSLVVAAGKAK